MYEDGNKAQIIQISDNVIEDVAWDRTGQYTYKVIEKNPNASATITNDKGATITYSEQIFYLNVIVEYVNGEYVATSHSIQISKVMKLLGERRGGGKLIQMI